MEIQCNINQQERIAQLLMEIFGEKLSLVTDRNINSNKFRTLPSPNDLRGKIIIKVKQSKKIFWIIFLFRVKNYLQLCRMKFIKNMVK